MNIVDLISDHARAAPDAAAILFPGGALTRAHLDWYVRVAGRHFSGCGLREGALVGLEVSDPILHLICALGLAAIGVAHIGVPTSDPLPVREQTLASLGVDVAITDSPEDGARGVRLIRIRGFGTPGDGLASPLERFSTDATLTWLLIRSSGTTGDPKFAQLDHAVSMQRHRRYSDAYGYRPGDVFWCGIDISTVTGKQHNLSALQAGVAICVPLGLRGTDRVLEFVRSCGVSLAYDIPSHLWGLAKCSEGVPCLPGVRRFFVGTTEVTDDLRREFMTKVCPNLYVNYGTNEAPCAAVASPELYARVPGTVGIPHPELEFEVVDEHGVRVQDGVTGEIRMRGPGIVSAYYRNPQATAQAFRNGWFHPGDLAYVAAEGALVLQGRTDDMLICDGVNIYPSEVERVLLLHPLIREAAVFGIGHRRYGQVPAAAVVLGAPMAKGELLRWCAARLGIKAPKTVVAVRALPRNASGKIMRRELVKQFSSPASG